MTQRNSNLVQNKIWDCHAFNGSLNITETSVEVRGYGKKRLFENEQWVQWFRSEILPQKLQGAKAFAGWYQDAVQWKQCLHQILNICVDGKYNLANILNDLALMRFSGLMFELHLQNSVPKAQGWLSEMYY